MQQHTTCPYCGVGCGVAATIENGVMTGVEGDRAHPANYGRLCVKGSALHETLGDHGRLLAPRVDGREVSWDDALDQMATRLAAVRDEHGGQAIAGYLSGQLLTEDYYAANKLFKGFLGSPHLDTNSRLCMASAVAGYKRAFGADAVPCNYEDLEEAELVVLVGSNLAWNHPVLFQRLRTAKQRNPLMRVVVVDPRVTDTCEIADLYLPIAPGSDARLFNGLLAFMADKGRHDTRYLRRHTRGVEEALAAARAEDTSLAALAEACDVDAEALETFYYWFASQLHVVTLYSQGINQSTSGTDKCNAIINCHLAGGKLGLPGAGPFSITGQPNAMGGREVGGLANQLAAHMDYHTPGAQALVKAFWDAPHLPEEPGLKAVELFAAVERGEIQALWIMATNPVVSLPDADQVKRALAACPLVIVSECMADTDTLAYADIVLPATSWSEKDGTVTNSERRISRQRGMLPPPGEARHDWWIIAQVAKHLGYEEAFEYRHPRDIFVEHARLSGYGNHAGGIPRLFDISALSDLDRNAYDALVPLQWPVTAEAPQGTARLFETGRFATPDGLARLVPVRPALPEQAVETRYPLRLNSGRVRDQWHTMTRTARAAPAQSSRRTLCRYPPAGCPGTRPRRRGTGAGLQPLGRSPGTGACRHVAAAWRCLHPHPLERPVHRGRACRHAVRAADRSALGTAGDQARRGGLRAARRGRGGDAPAGADVHSSPPSERRCLLGANAAESRPALADRQHHVARLAGLVRRAVRRRGDAVVRGCDQRPPAGRGASRWASGVVADGRAAQ